MSNIVSDKVDLNSASADEMQQFCHMKASTAGTIIRFRPFRHVDELEKVPGINVLEVMALKRLGCTVPERKDW